MYKVKLEAVEASASNPYIHYSMKLQAVIKSGMSQVTGEEVLPCPGGCPRVTWGQSCTCSHTGSLPGTDAVVPLTMKKFVSHATCYDSLGLKEQESYLIMGQTSDLWKVETKCVWRGLLTGFPSLPRPSPQFHNFC